MFLRSNNRKKDGKEHRYWSVVENRRLSGGKSVQKTLLYLGEPKGRAARRQAAVGQGAARPSGREGAKSMTVSERSGTALLRPLSRSMKSNRPAGFISFPKTADPIPGSKTLPCGCA